MKYHRLSGLLVLCSLWPAGTVPGQAGGARPDYQNPALPTARRVEDLLARMTLEEKVAQMLCLWNAKRQITAARGASNPPGPRGWSRAGSGRFGRPAAGHGAPAQPGSTTR